jgi:3-oxoacyl-[acyl-carrier protein] reductase
VTGDGGPPVAVVTGVASGMGRATAERFVREGWRVVGVDLDRARLDALAAGCGGALLPAAADVVDPDAVRYAVEAALPPGPVRACVNAAGIFPPTSLDDYDESRYRRIFDVNVLGIVNVTAAVLPLLRRSGGGAIVNFASVDAYAPSPGQLLYAASKAAVVSLTRTLGTDLARHGVTVTAVAPGWVDTAGNRATGRMVGVEASIPVGRVASPEEIADWVWFLSGEGRAGYMTGETLVISGGLVTR